MSHYFTPDEAIHIFTPRVTILLRKLSGFPASHTFFLRLSWYTDCWYVIVNKPCLVIWYSYTCSGVGCWCSYTSSGVGCIKHNLVFFLWWTLLFCWKVAKCNWRLIFGMIMNLNWMSVWCNFSDPQGSSYISHQGQTLDIFWLYPVFVGNIYRERLKVPKFHSLMLHESCWQSTIFMMWSQCCKSGSKGRNLTVRTRM